LTGKGFLLSGYLVGVIDRQLGVDDTPVLPMPSPFLRNVHHGEIQHFQQTVIRRENCLGFGDLAKLAIETLNDIDRIDQPTNFLWKSRQEAAIRRYFFPYTSSNASRALCAVNSSTAA
jgi:hypothetical protein